MNAHDHDLLLSSSEDPDESAMPDLHGDRTPRPDFRSERSWRAWLIVGLCSALVTLGAGVVEAKRSDPAKKCEGTKAQRKQKFEKRSFSTAELNQTFEEYRQAVALEQERMRQTMVRRLEREYETQRVTGEPFIYDVLIISGGGAKGAFGAGFLQGWAEIESGPYARPKFDVVTGVSTGALIAPFALIGTPESYADVVRFYSNPDPDWARKRGTINILRRGVSMLNNCHLQDTVRESVDRTIVEQLAQGYAEDRLLMIGATNLDLGAGRVFELGYEAQRGLEQGSRERIHSILLASSAIPGAFPPVEIDKMLYADGGATSNLFIMVFSGEKGPFTEFRRAHPEAPWPRLRLWILVNQKLLPPRTVTAPTWVEISSRALSSFTTTSQLLALSMIRGLVEQIDRETPIEADWHLVSIPEDAPSPPAKQMFDQDYMRQLVELGRKMGADPASWTKEIPSIYHVGGRARSDE